MQSMVQGFKDAAGSKSATAEKAKPTLWNALIWAALLAVIVALFLSRNS